MADPFQSATDATRAEICTQLATLTGISGVADVKPAAQVSDCWFVAKGRPTVLVVYGGCKMVGASPIGSRSYTPVEQDWFIVTVAQSFRTPTEAFTLENGADALAEAARGIRSKPIGAGSQKNFVYLKLVSEAVYAPEGRPETGGPVAYVCHYRTSQMIV